MAGTVGDFQLSVLQEFFRIRMRQAYGNNWVIQVKTIVQNKFANNDSHKQNYQGIYDILQKEGVETLDEKGMDITSLTSLMLYDFSNQCKVGSNFPQQIRNIRTDKNNLVSHISNPGDILNKKILELTALKNLRSFLTYVQNSHWAYPSKQEFVDRNREQYEVIRQELFREMAIHDQETIEFESNRQSYLVRIASERAENAMEYIPLSYKVDDGTSQRFELEQLFSLEANKDGFVLFSREAGYGKSWSIQELAGACAESVLNETDTDQATPILIRMGELAVSDEPIMKAIQEILYPGDESIERTRKYVGQTPIVLFIDGMDEAQKENKDPAWRELKKLLSSAKNIRIIGGTRESDKQWYPAGLSRYLICDLSDKQVEAYIEKAYASQLLTKGQKEAALFDYFKNPRTAFLKNLRSPFYLKCFIDFIREGEANPDSDTDMMNRCIDRMIEREISLKGFKVTIQIVNDFLAKLSELIGNDRRYIPEQSALKIIKDSLIYDEENYASIVQIKDTLIELQILKEVTAQKRPAQLGFWHEKYKSLYSPIALDTSLWDY